MAPSSDLDIHCKLQIEIVSGQPAMDLRRWYDAREVSLAAHLPPDPLQVRGERILLGVVGVDCQERRTARLANQIAFCSFLYKFIC